MPTPQPFPVLSRRSLLAAAVALILIFLGATAAVVLVMRNQAIENAEENLGNAASVLAEYLRYSAQAANLVLAATAQDVSAGAGLGDRVMHERLRERAAPLPQLLEVSVIDRDGLLRNHSRLFPPPPESVADRDFFAVHRAGRGDRLHIGMPTIGRYPAVWQQNYSRRLEDARKEFAGVVSAGVRSDYAHSFFRSLKLGAGGRVNVFRADGVMLNTYPVSDKGVGRSFAGDPLFTRSLGAAAAGVQRRAGFIEPDPPRFFAFQRVAGYPIVVTVSSTENHVLSEWRGAAAQLAAGALVGSTVVGLMLLLALRQMRVSAALHDELKESGDRLHGIIHSAMDAVITVDEDQKILLFNAAAERIFRCPAADAVGSHLERFVPERFRAAHRQHVEQFGVTGTTSRHMGGTRLDLRGVRADGEEFPIDASISQVTAGGRKLYTVVLRDVTQRRRAENELQRAYHDRREAADQLRGIIQSAMDAVITMDEDHKIILFNDAAEKIFRCRAEQAVGGPLERFIPERLRAAHRSHIARFGETRVTTRIMGKQQALVGLRADGEEFPIDASISQVTVEGRKLYTVILRDVTQRKQAEQALERSYEELRQLSAAMHDVREAERTRIARELHDELAQWLTALKMDVSWLSARLPAEPAGLLRRTDKMKQLLDATVTAVRRIAADLRPVMLDDLGLVPSIEHVVHTFSERTGVPVSLDIRAEGSDLGEPLATGVYRMVQEALTNVARHARATDVRVSLSVEGDMIEVRVRDNGVGLSDAPAAARSHGILGIKERAQTLGGSARIYSPPERGTVVEISIPLARYRKPEAAA